MSAENIWISRVRLSRASQVVIVLLSAVVPIALVMGMRGSAADSVGASAYFAVAAISSAVLAAVIAGHWIRARRFQEAGASGTQPSQPGKGSLQFPWDVRDTGLSFEIRDAAKRRIAFVWYVPPEKNDLRDEARLDKETAQRVANMIVQLSRA